ncbi:MAG: hypothetical protein ND895_15470 [Pyrinomonadaceae bacterium]|nr:hypothetical protein [Pyrinomonadaceae bacterium]
MGKNLRRVSLEVDPSNTSPPVGEQISWIDGGGKFVELGADNLAQGCKSYDANDGDQSRSNGVLGQFKSCFIVKKIVNHVPAPSPEVPDCSNYREGGSALHPSLKLA